MNCERFRDHLEGYALDALEPDERDAVERHLATCDRCRQEVAALKEVIALFPEALATARPVTPPATQKSRLLDAVSDQPAASTPQQAATPRHSDPRSRKAAPSSRRSHRAWRMLATAVPFVLLVFSLVWGFRLADALDRERDLKAEYLDLLDEVVGQQELVFEVIGFDDTHRMFLRAQQDGSTSYGKVFTRPSMPYVVVMAGRLPQAPAGSAFHVWLTSDGETTHAGEMTVDADGFGILLYTADQPGPVYDTAFVTLQPSGTASPAGTEILRHEPDDS